MLDLLTNPAVYGLLLGIVTPLVTSVVQRPSWSRNTRKTVAVICAAVVGVCTVGAAGSFGNGTVTTATIVATVAAAQTAYKRLWRKSGVTDRIEKATSPKPAPATVETEAAPSDLGGELGQDPPTD